MEKTKPSQKSKNIAAVIENGILPDDPRLLRNSSDLLRRAKANDFVIPDFSTFTAQLQNVFNKVARIEDGKVATYIPQLAQVSPELFGAAVCTVDGQRWSSGDARIPFSLQSVSKPINYCLALEENGRDKVHQHVGREPSGHSFNAITLDSQNRPHNPMINAGALASLSLVQSQMSLADRFDYITKTWQSLSGGMRPGFNTPIYLSEKATADRNYALAYFMREKGVFPAGTDLHITLDLYFQCCSIEVTCESLSIVAATLANGGINPFTGEKVFHADTVKDCLSLMHSCGMYDFSGEFAFLIGLPAKSGVSGGLMVVVPNTLGLALYSPRVDIHGNTVRGVEFCKEMIALYNFHPYDSLAQSEQVKIDPRLKANSVAAPQIQSPK